MPAQKAVTLFRPTGERELALVLDSGWKAFPPRLPDQPFFYPVLNDEYATQIARDWNTKDGGTGWIPAEDLEAFNRHLVGPIEMIAVYSSANAQS